MALAAEQHAVAHHVAVGERDLDRPLAVADADGRLDHVALLALAVGAAHFAPVHQARGAFDLDVVRRGTGCTPKRTLRDRAGPNGSTKKACSADVRAPVSTLALMAGRPSSGSATHSSQPRINGAVTGGMRCFVVSAMR